MWQSALLFLCEKLINFKVFDFVSYMPILIVWKGQTLQLNLLNLDTELHNSSEKFGEFFPWRSQLAAVYLWKTPFLDKSGNRRILETNKEIWILGFFSYNDFVGKTDFQRIDFSFNFAKTKEPTVLENELTFVHLTNQVILKVIKISKTSFGKKWILNEILVMSVKVVISSVKI